MHSLQKMSFSVLLCGVLVASSILFVPTDSLGALPKKKLEIIIGGDNFCKDDKDCAGDSFCNMTSHICIICPKPFEWVGGTQCVCPSGSVPNADNTDCVECMTDSNCQDLKGNLHWVCDTDTNTCACMSGLHEESGECVCDNPNKKVNEDGNCICQITQDNCPVSDFNALECMCCDNSAPKLNGTICEACSSDRTYNAKTHACECINGEDDEGKCCSEDEHLDNGICCPFGQRNYEGLCTCENPKNNCGKACCNGIGETCKDAENSICCSNELCNGICCPTNSMCQEGVCINPCQEDEVLVNYFDTTGKKYQTCCPEGTEGADSNGQCCPEGLVGAFGHNHNWVYISKCCPKEGQEDKGMVGLRGLSETYTCAPPDTTMEASANPGDAFGHTWYVPIGSKNVQGSGWACAPETSRKGVLHATCGSTGQLCQHGWRLGTDCSYCHGEVINGICQLPDCTKPREHLAYCNCNTENRSAKEYTYQGGTWASHYVIDICTTPPKDTDKSCTPNLTFLYSGTCYHCATYFKSYYSSLTDSKVCLNCPDAVWKDDKCLICPTPGKPTADRSGCQGHYLATNNTYYACDNVSQYPASSEQECDICGAGVRIWRSVYKDCISCDYPSALTSTKAECLECDNRYWTGTNEGSGTCYLCSTITEANAKNITDKNSCLNCEQTVWTENGICAYCPPENQINNRSSCQGRYLGTNNISYACDNASQYLASVEQECDSCGEGVRVWRSVYKDCISCSYTSKFTSTKDECLECDNRYFVGTNEKSGYCYLCPTGQKRNQEGVCE